MQYLGIVDVTWRQKRFNADKGSKLKLGGIKGTAVVTARRVGYSQEFEPSEITASFPLERGMSLMDMWRPGEGELIVLADTGQTYTWSDAFLTNRPEATGGEGGKVEAKWTAGEPEEIVGA